MFNQGDKVILKRDVTNGLYGGYEAVIEDVRQWGYMVKIPALRFQYFCYFGSCEALPDEA